MKKIIAIVTLMELFWLCAWAQPSDSLPAQNVLKEVRIDGLLERDVVSSEEIQTNAAQNLGQYLQTKGYCQIQAHGPEGTLMSLRQRGMSSDYTTIYWNDIPLNSITHGGMDVSLVPLFFIDEIENDRANNQNTRQWNNVNNGLYLRSTTREVQTSNQIRLVESYSSLRNSTTGLEYSWNQRCNRKAKDPSRLICLYGGTSRFFYQRLLNEFTYVDEFSFDRRITKQAHNNGENMGWLQTIYASKGNHRLEGDFWGQRKKMHLPLRMGQTGQSAQLQEDQIHRMSVRYLFSKDKFILRSSLAENKEVLDYRDLRQADGTWLIDSRSVATSRFWNNTAQIVYRNQWRLGATVLGVQQNVENNNYSGSRLRQHWLQLAGNGAWIWGAHTFMFGARHEFRPVATSTNWNISYQLEAPVPAWRARFQVHFQVSRKFRAPDLNDLYWVPGGNPDLKSEAGYTGESHFHLRLDIHNRVNVTYHGSAYYTTLNDMIVWQPTDDNVWSPFNISKVVSYGADNSVSLSYDGGSVDMHLIYRSQINQSISANKVVPYMPRQIHASTARINWKAWQGEVIGTYTSRRFTETENKLLLSLEPYWIFGGQIGFKWSVNKHALDIHVGVFNAANVAYQSVRSYAMPGRYYQLQLSYQFKKSHRKNENEEHSVRQLNSL